MKFSSFERKRVINYRKVRIIIPDRGGRSSIFSEDNILKDRKKRSLILPCVFLKLPFKRHCLEISKFWTTFQRNYVGKDS